MSTKEVILAAKLKNIRKAYINQLPGQLQAMRDHFAGVDGEQAKASIETLHRLIHTMKGACASFRLGPVILVATSAERLAKEALQGPHPPGREWHQKMQGYLARLEYEISAIDPEQGVEQQIQDLTLAAQETPEREVKTVYLCEADSYQRLTMATQIGCFGFEVMTFAEPEHLLNVVQKASPDVIVMDMAFPDRPVGGAEIMETLQSGLETPIPIVFISTRNTLENRLCAVRASSSAYFVKPVDVTELCETLSRLTSAVKPDPYRILIVDDDPQLAEYHALILQEAGMVTQTVNDPLQVMTPLYEFKPDLILMDMYMPGCNGMELAKAIRQIGTYFSIPIVYLSSETDSDKQFEAMRLGGDEFLTKPIKSHHLVSSVAVRAERMKIIRSRMARDNMTGLFNHTTTKELLQTTISHAQRKQEELCLAIIDVDRFKTVNDTYGHPVGDNVLVSLARLVSQRVRKADIVGRTGGEEFAVIFPGCTLRDVAVLINDLRESFSLIRFQAKEESFSCTFSCGIAALSACSDAAELNAAADGALYEAKNGGRNRVVLAGGEELKPEHLAKLPEEGSAKPSGPLYYLRRPPPE